MENLTKSKVDISWAGNIAFPQKLTREKTVSAILHCTGQKNNFIW